MSKAINQLAPWQSGGRVTEPELKRLTKTFGQLPQDYESFLRKFGASKFDGIASLKARGTEYSLIALFGHGPAYVSVIARNFSERDEATPADCVHVGTDEWGNAYLLNVRDGAILYWDRDRDPNERPDAVKQVARSFAEFMDRIVVEKK